MIMQYNDKFGPIFINRETGIKPDIDPSVSCNGLIDCIYKITIEKDVFFGHDVFLLTGGHDPTKFGDERRHSSKGGPIIIHEGVWIASRAIIVGPCEIGKHAVIGAGSVIVHDVPEYELWAGNPAVYKKYYEH